MDQPPPNPDDKFLFIAADADAKSREARAHVAKTSSQRKKQRHRVAPRGPERKSTFFPWGVLSTSPDAAPETASSSNLTDSADLSFAIGAEAEAAVDTDADAEESAESSSAQESRFSSTSLVVSRTNRGQQPSLGRRQSPPMLTALNSILKGQSDPFDAASIPITAKRHDSLLLSRDWYAHSKWPIDVGARSQSITLQIWEHDMKHAITHTAAIQGLLALCSAHRARLRPPTNAPPDPELLQHKILCIRSVRATLTNNAVEPNLILAVILLGAADFYADKIMETVLHIQAVKRIADSLGGLANLSRSIKDEVAMADSVTAWRLKRPPVFSVDDWDPGPWHAQEQSKVYHLHLEYSPQALQPDSAWQNNPDWPNEFLQMIGIELNEMVRMKTVLGTVRDPQDLISILKYLHIRRAAIKIRLLEHYLQLDGNEERSTETESNSQASLARAASVCAMYCHGLLVYATEPIVIHFPAEIVRECLQTHVFPVETTDHTVSSRLLLWLYFIGAVAEETSIPSIQDGEKEIRARFINRVRMEGFTSWEEISSILCCFLHGEVMDEYLFAFLNDTNLSQGQSV